MKVQVGFMKVFLFKWFFSELDDETHAFCDGFDETNFNRFTLW